MFKTKLFLIKTGIHMLNAHSYIELFIYWTKNIADTSEHISQKSDF